VRDDAVEAVRAMKADSPGLLSTIGSISLRRSLLRAGIVDRFRVVMFPVITGATGSQRIYDGYPDVALDMTASRTFDERIQLVEYRPRVLVWRDSKAALVMFIKTRDPAATIEKPCGPNPRVGMALPSSPGPDCRDVRKIIRITGSRSIP
jgi:hypothetical protein